ARWVVPALGCALALAAAEPVELGAACGVAADGAGALGAGSAAATECVLNESSAASPAAVLPSTMTARRIGRTSWQGKQVKSRTTRGECAAAERRGQAATSPPYRSCRAARTRTPRSGATRARH